MSPGMETRGELRQEYACPLTNEQQKDVSHTTKGKRKSETFLPFFTRSIFSVPLFCTTVLLFFCSFVLYHIFTKVLLFTKVLPGKT